MCLASAAPFVLILLFHFPEKGLEAKINRSKSTLPYKRSLCTVSYFVPYQATLTYKNGMSECEKYGGTLARPMGEDQVIKAESMMFSERSISRKNYSQWYIRVGAMAQHRYFYRWNDGILLDNGPSRLLWRRPHPNGDPSKKNSIFLVSDEAHELHWQDLDSENTFAKSLCERCVHIQRKWADVSNFFVHKDGSISWYQPTNERYLTLSPTSATDYLPCPRDRFGLTCSSQCRCKNDEPCHLTSGHCPNGCQENWTGRTCSETVCPRHRFGPFCRGFCYCRYGDQCNATTGDCYHGCPPGMYGPTCTFSKCPVGKYGQICLRNCMCGPGVPCAIDSGRCFSDDCEKGHCFKYRMSERKISTIKNDGCGSGSENGTCTPPTSLEVNRKREFCQRPGVWGPNCDIVCLTRGCTKCVKHTGEECQSCPEGFGLHPHIGCVRQHYHRYIVIDIVLYVIIMILLLIMFYLIFRLVRRLRRNQGSRGSDSELDTEGDNNDVADEEDQDRK